MRSETHVLFVGPTLHGLPKATLQAAPFTLRPPVKRGDVTELIEHHAAGTIVLVDGVFHSHPAVGHYELRMALERGWEIWGLSSMGAIRACEMHSLGMRGFGEVFEQYVAHEEFTDDEVTLLHEPDEPYEPVSEPLVHIRAVLASLVSDRALPAEVAAQIVARLKELWFGYRTLSRLTQLMQELFPQALDPLAAKLRTIDLYRTKTLDLRCFLEQQPWTARRMIAAERQYPMTGCS